MIDKKKIEAEVDKNYEFFKEHKGEISSDNSDKFVLIHNQQFVGFFDSENDAISAGRIRYEDACFSVQKVTEESVELGFVGYALF